MTQNQAILKYLKKGKRITPMIAYEKFGCLRLSERVREINFSHLPMKTWINKSWKKVGKKRVMEYFL